MLLLAAEWIGVSFSWICKWCKASSGRRIRKVGFILSCILNIYFAGYFYYTGQYGFVANAVVNMYIIVRGIKNNL